MKTKKREKSRWIWLIAVVLICVGIWFYTEVTLIIWGLAGVVLLLIFLTAPVKPQDYENGEPVNKSSDLLESNEDIEEDIE